jgi:hypothetical protein
MADLKQMSDSELAEWIAGWKPGTKDYILGMAELDRRKNRGNTVRGWIAIAVSVLALIVSIVALFYKRAF